MPLPPREQIAIDGPAASGKSTVAQSLADLLGGTYVNTGEMYRAVAWWSRRQGINPTTDSCRLGPLLSTCDLHHELVDHRLVLVLDGAPVPVAELRQPQMAQLASAVAAMPAVRAWLLERQRSAAQLGLVVLEGRDIGTVVFPQARHKFFLSASPEERARRRLAQAGEAPDGATLASVARDIAERDERDRTRAIAPLVPAPDALAVDTTGMNAAQVVAQLAGIIRARWAADPI